MIGSRLAHYEITGHLGSGGMGDVYQATDTKLGRSVAIKVLPDGFAADIERAARFEREARVLASLNHPHIAAIYGLEVSLDRKFLVMELVEGKTLADRLAELSRLKPQASGLPLDETLHIARQIAGALEAAHDTGVIHRDLKPANIKVTPAGQVKVLDFGLAKAFVGDAAEANLTNSPTMIAAATSAGVVLGTAAYMSPEQARGREVDKRTDIFAFGCVLYEMLTGRPAFPGDTVTEILARVIEREPDWSLLPPGLTARVQDLLRGCLEKDPRKRRRDSGDLRLDLERTLVEPALAVVPLVQAAAGRARTAWIVAGLLAAALAAVLVASYFRQPARPPEMRVEIDTPPTADSASFAISPDGRQLVYAGPAESQRRLHLRVLDASQARPLPGTEGATYPFWSPDGRSIGFFGGDGKLSRIEIGGGPATVLGQGQPGLGGTWSTNGTVLFAPFAAGPLFRVPASGGEAVPATKVSPGQLGHSFPTFIGDSPRFLFYVRGPDEIQGIYLGSLDSADTTRLTPADTPGLYTSQGWLLFGSQGKLVARRFDPTRKELNGDPIVLAESLASNSIGLFVARPFSASNTGHVVYRVGGPVTTQLTWFDRSGRALGSIGTPDRADLANPAISPDGSRVAFDRTLQGNTDIWLVEGERLTRLTSEPTVDQFPIWSPRGNRIIFGTSRGGGQNIYQKPSRAEGSEEPLLEGPPPLKAPSDVSSDDQFLLYFSVAPKTATDIWVLPLKGGDKPFPFLNTSFAEVWGQFSSDGRWVAYQSNESGQWEIYVRPFPGPGGQWLISTAGGVYPRWASDGKELYYIDPTGKLMAVTIGVKNDALEVGRPGALFQTHILGGGTNMVGRNQQYDVAPDGRFLINVLNNEPLSSSLTMLLNWNPQGN
jgi:eukaryotic-like serine/threonine-protein kinase